MCSTFYTPSWFMVFLVVFSKTVIQGALLWSNEHVPISNSLTLRQVRDSVFSMAFICGYSRNLSQIFYAVVVEVK